MQAALLERHMGRLKNENTSTPTSSQTPDIDDCAGFSAASC
jgi:hypothetical protein